MTSLGRRTETTFPEGWGICCGMGLSFALLVNIVFGCCKQCLRLVTDMGVWSWPAGALYLRGADISID